MPLFFLLSISHCANQARDSHDTNIVIPHPQSDPQQRAREIRRVREEAKTDTDEWLENEWLEPDDSDNDARDSDEDDSAVASDGAQPAPTEAIVPDSTPAPLVRAVQLSADDDADPDSDVAKQLSHSSEHVTHDSSTSTTPSRRHSARSSDDRSKHSRVSVRQSSGSTSGSSARRRRRKTDSLAWLVCLCILFFASLTASSATAIVVTIRSKR